MIELKVTGDTLEGVLAQMKTMTDHLSFEAVAPENMVTKDDDEEEELQVPARKAKRERPAKKEEEPVQEEIDEELLGGKELTIEDDVMPAFVAYVQKHSKDEAKAILAKFKVKAVRELKPEQYAAAIKAVS